MFDLTLFRFDQYIVKLPFLEINIYIYTVTYLFWNIMSMLFQGIFIRNPLNLKIVTNSKLSSPMPGLLDPPMLVWHQLLRRLSVYLIYSCHWNTAARKWVVRTEGQTSKWT